MADQDFPSPSIDTVVPSGPELVAVVSLTIVAALRAGQAPQIALPSPWRLAYHVVNEVGPLSFYSWQQAGKP